MSEPSANSSAFTELILEVFRLNGLLLEAGDRLTHPVGLSSARWQVLGVVEHQPTPVAHVARIMGLTRQSVQQTADALANDGFITYTDNPHHRRAKLMTITPKGRKALDYVQQCQADWANQVSETLSLEALKTAVTVLRQLKERLETHKTDGLDE
ncbi:MarR family transcriptional regulator [Trichocoleus sp. FACHB-832]|uniref:MarR family winged helix-turn-helix transcriptional regulator n=1 Tax=Trichocoleus sp. FACHB-832 TaxID=2692875 RepID=UPI0016828CA6|nr:MarR family winged helix-turn-helix transcriptional regulator [Trichocoleus sp. FACHB-832]MBD1908888.1 MarR family transcriptional regulator [Trichocoleus sp. FACHB-832]